MDSLSIIWALIGIVAAAGVVVGLVWTLISVVLKKNKKIPLLVSLFSFVISTVFIISGTILFATEESSNEETLEITTEQSESLKMEGKETSNKSAEELFEEFKKNCLENTRKEVAESDMALNLAGEYLEESFFHVKQLNNFYDIKDDELSLKFIHAISYFSVYMEEESIGNVIGDKGWEAIESLALSDGQFEKKMDLVKKAYEFTGMFLFENKFTSGQYKVGIDIPAGEYVIFADGSSGYFSITSDANGNDIIANENFKYNSIMTVMDGEYLELSRAYAVPINDVSSLPVDKADMFKIGVFLPAGEYKVVSDLDTGYYCIYEDNRQDDIVANDNFNGQSYITVSNGQYLVLSNCHIEQ